MARNMRHGMHPDRRVVTYVFAPAGAHYGLGVSVAMVYALDQEMYDEFRKFSLGLGPVPTVDSDQYIGFVIGVGPGIDVEAGVGIARATVSPRRGDEPPQPLI